MDSNTFACVRDFKLVLNHKDYTSELLDDTQIYCRVSNNRAYKNKLDRPSRGYNGREMRYEPIDGKPLKKYCKSNRTTTILV
jgi:hypothetical protein